MAIDPSLITVFLDPIHAFFIVGLYIIGIGLKRMGQFRDTLIPVALAAISLVLCILYTISSNPLPGDVQSVCSMTLNTIIQAFCCVAGAVYFNQVKKQIVKMVDENKSSIKESE